MLWKMSLRCGFRTRQQLYFHYNGAQMISRNLGMGNSVDDLNRLLSDLQTDENLRAWLIVSPNESAADVVLSDVGYNVSMAELRESMSVGLRQQLKDGIKKQVSHPYRQKDWFTNWLRNDATLELNERK